MRHIETHTKQPGHLVLRGSNLFIVAPDGNIVPHEQPHRRAQRERMEMFRRGWK